MWFHFVVDPQIEGLLRREEPALSDINYSYSPVPVGRATNVFFAPGAGTIAEEIARHSLIVLLEPPSFADYRLSELRKFARVIGPKFPIAARLSNHFCAGGLSRWRIGVSHEAGRTVPWLSRDEIATFQPPPDEAISAVVSSKRRTRNQRWRVRLAQYLNKHIDKFVLFGRETFPIEDKLDAHRLGRFHLAIENSSYPFYYTEKLTDALLVGNHIFYSGHRTSTDVFETGQITYLQRGSSSELVREVIEEKLQQPISQLEMHATSANRRLVLEKYNLHSQVVAAMEPLRNQNY